MTEVSVLAAGLACPEGPDVLPDGRIVFVETFLGRISAWDAQRGIHAYAHVGGGPNACVLGLDALYVAQTGGHAGPWRSSDQITPSIQKVTEGGEVEEVVTEVDGQPLLGPNDLTFGADQRLYFTDPGVFDPDDPANGRICVVEADGTGSILEEIGPVYPNGIAAEADAGIVWSESFSRRIRRRLPDGTLELLATLPEDRIPDGLKLDVNGVLYVAGVTSGGFDLIAPDGRGLGFIEAGTPLNCVFCGSSLYVTDWGEPGPEADEGAPVRSGRLLRLRLDVEGPPLFRGTIERQAKPGAR